ncbi:hypothetical protein BWQ96_03855 [Gracilariopsis chorda]|uniref:Protein ZIP4 homolog n=1 Tax=Gracilariopsis chorda TaxID=448386 RepID=A0A2V3IW30_9FLOR|nr:hypothetical protein BWQ96_03855 [Gracilariopsis chorda]|eukprot:PXF46356.1 hypothetical protein BWQ96_03855 [Gracilariopsis chorda]
METVGDERLRASNSLKQLEEAALMLEDLSKSNESKLLSAGFPSRLSVILNSINSIPSRDDAERLLSAGVSMWNSIISIDEPNLEEETMKALVRVRHVAVDCMYMSTTALGGISARYNIDDLTLLKFYTACGQKYAAEIGDMDCAEVCFAKAKEFASKAVNEAHMLGPEKLDLSRAMFDLLIGRAECCWERGDSETAERYVNDARTYLHDLPGEFEFLATVEYNFGLFAYQEKQTDRALKWLRRSIETRCDQKNQLRNNVKQAKTMRLAGVCLLALRKYEESWNMMKHAEETHHDPIGSYLLLKLSIITKKTNASDLLLEIIEDSESTIDVCVAAVSLFGDAQRVSEAADGYKALYEKFDGDPRTQACVIGPRYFEALAAIGKIDKALMVLETCSSYISRLGEMNEWKTEVPKAIEIDDDNGQDQVSQFLRWSALLLSIGSAQADRKDFKSSALLLTKALSLARTAKDVSARRASSSAQPYPIPENVVLANEARICRLASSCALCSISEKKQSIKMMERNSEELEKDDKLMLELSLEHARRSKELEPDDYSPRLLLFRTHLIAGNYTEAASELENSSTEIRTFDAGALAEAACAARDVGSTTAVIAVLRCVIAMDTSILLKTLDSSINSPPHGFYGTVLLACINLQLRNMSGREGNDSATVESEDCDADIDAVQDLFHTLESGLQGIKQLGVDVAFDKSTIPEETIAYLVNVSWNAGRDAGTKMRYVLWDSFFAVCYEFTMFQQENIDVFQTRRMSKLMSACANIENPKSDTSNYEKARVLLQDARRDSQKMRLLSSADDEDPLGGVLLMLEARCCTGCGDLEGLSKIIETSMHQEVGAGVLEQLAAVCYHFSHGKSHDSQISARCADLTTALLSKASDRRLCEEDKDINALAITMREHLGIELSRGASTARSYNVFRKIAGVVLEYGDQYPVDERRWLVAVGWDRAQMHKQLGKIAEAKRWCELVLKVVADSIQLSTYRPRLDAFMKSVSYDT